MGVGSPLEPLLSLLAQGAYIGLHLIVARSTSGAMRALSDPVIRRMWELGSPGVVFSYPRRRASSSARPHRASCRRRAPLVTRRGVKLVQTGFVPAGAPGTAEDHPQLVGLEGNRR